MAKYLLAMVYVLQFREIGVICECSFFSRGESPADAPFSAPAGSFSAKY
jgi:hypothetical protein